MYTCTNVQTCICTYAAVGGFVRARVFTWMAICLDRSVCLCMHVSACAIAYACLPVTCHTYVPLDSINMS